MKEKMLEKSQPNQTQGTWQGQAPQNHTDAENHKREQ